MLYLPPRYAHDGIAEGECMTYSIGFRAPGCGTKWRRKCCSVWPKDARKMAGQALYRDPAAKGGGAQR